ncbi:MAG: flagellar biosynthesis protein FlhF [Gammaproteobacteria bacterium]
MNMRTFHEVNMQDALYKIRDELGEEAVILSTKQSKEGVQVVAATDYDAAVNSSSNQMLQDEESTSHKTSNSEPDYANSIASQNIGNQINDTNMQNEISQLRNLIESQTEIISWNKIINENIIARKILQKLSISGFGFNFSKNLLKHVSDIKDEHIAWDEIESKISSSIAIIENNIIETGGVAALVGPTGVGKTTTIAKIAAQYVLKHGSNHIVLISADHYRIGAHDQISTYASILNVPVIAATNKSELQQVLHVVRDKKLILIDTPGLSQRDDRVSEIMKTLSEQSKSVDTYLVISAASQLCVQKEIINQFNSKILNGAIISKSDEASQIGGVLTSLIEQGIPIAFETTGQHVPEDIICPDQTDLLNKAVHLGEQFGSMETFHPTELFSELVENV